MYAKQRVCNGLCYRDIISYRTDISTLSDSRRTGAVGGIDDEVFLFLELILKRFFHRRITRINLGFGVSDIILIHAVYDAISAAGG